jgi:hypothetical protein
MHRLPPRTLGIAKATAAVICFLLLGTATSYAKEWRGITPLHSTRADVERILGKPTKSFNDGEYFFDLKDEVVLVWFETSGCDNATYAGNCGWAWDVPIGTVTSIGVVYKNQPLVAGFISGGGFKEEQSCAGLVFYENKNEGIAVEAYEGRVLSVSYTHRAAEEHLDCPALVPCNAPHYRKYDEYGNIGFEDEKARLDNVAVELQNAPNLRVAILAYGGRGSRPDAAIKRAERAKRYLVSVRHINPWQVVTASCGYREDLTIELVPHGSGAWHIYASPTVDPSAVKPHARKTPRRK